MKRVLTLLAAMVVSCLPGIAAAGAVVLSVRAGGELHEFTLSQLRELGEVQVDTSTIWTEGEQAFVGVPLKTLMSGLGVEAGSITAAAVNDYAVEIPLSEANSQAPIIAYERNGATMSLRDKGPLWVIYPYDSDPSYRTEEVYSRSIWQLNRLAVK